MNPKWLQWAQEIQSISQSGLEYTRDAFDKERFQKLQEISAEIMSEYTDIDDRKIRDLFTNEKGYQTPKIDVRAVVPDGERILFIQESNDRKWALPGGWAEINLTLKECIKKEVREEAGILATPKNIIAILDRNKYSSKPYPYSVYKIFVLCDYVSGEFENNPETLTMQFYSQKGIPELSEGRNTYEQIEMCFEYLKSNKKDVIFD